MGLGRISQRLEENQPSALDDAIEVKRWRLLTATAEAVTPWMVFPILLKRVPPHAWGVGLADVGRQEEAFMMATAGDKRTGRGTPNAM